MRENLVVIVGPTAVGKTALSIELAKRFAGEIISGDSMQVYRGMDIGTAKITSDEMEGIPHYFIDTHAPDEAFSAVEFQQQAKRFIRDCNERGKLPIIVGGTGLYIQSVIYDYQFSSAPQDQEFRSQMETLVSEQGKAILHERLVRVDPITAKRLHPNDVKRIIRALEIHHQTGLTMADFQQRSEQSPYELRMIGLTMDRSLLYERINQRVDLMIAQGLIEEVECLLDHGYQADLSSMQAIGYKEIIDYIQGKQTREEAIELLKKNSRNYAKRQLTWFRNMQRVQWFDVTERSCWQEIVEKIQYDVAGMFR
jgi:tRNA dimethylallyltransferase